MDFTFTDEQLALRDLCRSMCTDLATPERLRELEREGGARLDELWRALAEAGVLGVPLSEDVGGAGAGLIELCIVLEEIGRAVAPVPAFPTLVLGALAVDAFGSPEQRSSLLGSVASGEVVLTAALHEPGNDDPTQPQTKAEAVGDGWSLSGTKVFVPAADAAHRILVPAATSEGVRVFLVDPRGPGVDLKVQTATNLERQATVVLEGAEADALPVPGEEVLAFVTERALLGLCAMHVGVAAKALEMTATYTAEREQFNRPIATFQSAQHRIADAYIDVEAMRWTMWNAAWRLSEGLPAAEAIAVAKLWACDGGHRVTAAAQHLHGGIGVDVDYPLYRYSLWSKQLELTLGGAGTQLTRLGELMASRAPEDDPR